MVKLISFLVVTLVSVSSFAASKLTAAELAEVDAASPGYEGIYFNNNAIPQYIQDVKFLVYDLNQTSEGCSSGGTCFRMEVLLNGVSVARIVTSPGKPGDGGIYTPLFEGISINPKRLMGAGYRNSKGDRMPYAMFTMQYKSSGDSGVAIHEGYGTAVNGNFASHGCMRVKRVFAPLFSKWVKEAFSNAGNARIWTDHTNGRDYGYNYITTVN